MANFDLVNWTMRKARQLSPEDQMQRETDGSHLLDKLLEVLEDTRIKPSDFAANPQETIPRMASAPSVQLTDDSPVATPPNEVDDRTEANTASDLRVSTQAAPLAPADVPAVPMSALLKAIVNRISARMIQLSTKRERRSWCDSSLKA